MPAPRDNVITTGASVTHPYLRPELHPEFLLVARQASSPLATLSLTTYCPRSCRASMEQCRSRFMFDFIMLSLFPAQPLPLSWGFTWKIAQRCVALFIHSQVYFGMYGEVREHMWSPHPIGYLLSSNMHLISVIYNIRNYIFSSFSN